MNFCSDNVTGVAPEIMAALAAANHGTAAAYGNDDWTRQVEAQLCDIFERKVRAFPVATGTASNSLALATMAPPYGAILAHEAAHVMVDECGAPEFYSGGAKLVPVAGDHGKMSADGVAAAIARWRWRRSARRSAACSVPTARTSPPTNAARRNSIRAAPS